jgi:hypothetical protein
VSSKADRFRPRRRGLCAKCGEKRSGYVVKGVWRGDREHDLCKRCYRGVVEGVRVKGVSEGVAASEGHYGCENNPR